MTLRVEALRGDITTQDVDAVVNAANSTLLGGGGVDGAIHRAAGPSLLEECREVRRRTHRDGLPTGDAVVTGAGQMPARWVIHTVGPRHWEHPDGGRALLGDCHRRVLEEADRIGARSIAIPAISCGAYGWSPSEAAPIAVAAVRDHAAQHEGCPIELIRFVLSSDETCAVFAEACSVSE